LTDSAYLLSDAARLDDVARHVNASYWLTTPYDYPLQTPSNRALLVAKERGLLETAPVVYRSPDGHIVLYDTHRLWNAEGSNDPQQRTKSSSTHHSTRF
jgi:predicted metal-dependent enzyme (double-stranded beta helix superfamily)